MAEKGGGVVLYAKGSYTRDFTVPAWVSLFLQRRQINWTFLRYMNVTLLAVYLRITNIKKDPEKMPMFKKFIGWWIDKHYLLHPDEKIVMMFDMTDAGLANVVSTSPSVLPHYRLKTDDYAGSWRHSRVRLTRILGSFVEFSFWHNVGSLASFGLW